MAWDGVGGGGEFAHFFLKRGNHFENKGNHGGLVFAGKATHCMLWLCRISSISSTCVGVEATPAQRKREKLYACYPITKAFNRALEVSPYILPNRASIGLLLFDVLL